jgi:uncharacterized protein (TIGR03067 family)
MRRDLLTLVIVVFFVGAALSQDKAGKTDQDKFQGTWTFVSGERGGKPLPGDDVKDRKITFSGNKMKMKNKDQEREVTFKLNPDKKPKEIDVDFDGQIGKGIYQLDGDTLKVAHGELGDPRPTEFASKADSKVTLVVLKREKKP